MLRARVVVIVFAVILGLGVIGSAQAAVTNVWTYNGKGDGCKQVEWYLMGFMQANGTLGSIVGTDVIVDGMDKGDVISPGRFRNQAGTAETFDLSVRTFAEAYDVIDNTAGANLTSCGHGVSHLHAGAPHNGGALLLEGKMIYAGFGAGTGVPGAVGAPYPTNLPAPTANVTVHLHYCYSANDPDGGGSETSVVASLQADLAGGPGAATVTGHTTTTTALDLAIEKLSSGGGNTVSLCESGAVGGIAELARVDAAPLATSDRGSGLSTGVIAAIAAGAVAAVIALGATAWYGRRRWLR